ncbi:hypothetical protein CPB85DRAFT_601927 [Mucidula mucida]|nr:hypothetical protein CPB85DRAFT_601927 [Mucidula mucida]
MTMPFAFSESRTTVSAYTTDIPGPSAHAPSPPIDIRYTAPATRPTHDSHGDFTIRVESPTDTPRDFLGGGADSNSNYGSYNDPTYLSASYNNWRQTGGESDSSGYSSPSGSSSAESFEEAMHLPSDHSSPEHLFPFSYHQRSTPLPDVYALTSYSSPNEVPGDLHEYVHNMSLRSPDTSWPTSPSYTSSQALSLLVMHQAPKWHSSTPPSQTGTRNMMRTMTFSTLTLANRG